MSKLQLVSGANDQLIDVGMQQRLAAGDDEAVDARSDHAQHLQRAIEIELFLGLRIAPCAEVFAIGAVEVALRRDVVDGDERPQPAIAAQQPGQIDGLVEDRGTHIRLVA